MNVILSIKNIYAEKILSGEKGFEFRKNIFSKDVTTVLLYVTSPIKMIIGEFKIDGILIDTPNIIWQMTASQSGISKSFFFSYFKGRNKAFAIKVSEPKRFKDYINPFQLIPHFYPPQSFCYFNNLIRDDNKAQMPLLR